MTISSVAPAIVPGTGVSSAPGDGGLAGLFAGLLGAEPLTGDPAGSDCGGAGAGEVLVAVPEGPDCGTSVNVGIVELLGAAQLMAAAQVVPVTPVLPAALAAAVGSPAFVAAPTAPAPAGVVVGPVDASAPAGQMSSPTGVPTGSTAVSAGVPVGPSVSPSAVPLGAPAATEQPVVPPTNAPAVGVGVGAPTVAPDAVLSVPPTSTQPAGTAPTATPNAVPVDQQPADARPGSAPAITPIDGTVVGLTTTPQQGAHRDHGSGRRPGEPTAEPVTAPSGVQATTQAHAPQPAIARPEAQAATQVTGQVFPEVARLVSRGDGTQRITITLSPEALGDVRVVLTVRDGDVHVRMVGSEQAQQALRAGAPELHRLLDLAGAGSSQIVVGDHSSTADAGLPSGTSDRHTAHHTEDHRTAGTRDGDASARDGYPGARQPRRSTEPTADSGAVTTTLPGVDVTI